MSAYALPDLFPSLPFGCPQLGATSPKSNNEIPDIPTIGNDESYRFCEKNVVVKEVKVDTEQLVKSLTTNKRQAGGTHFRGKLRKSHRFSISARRRQPPIVVDESNPQELAMQFDLSISLQGRTYNFIRSLARIRQLYHELKEEAEGYDGDQDGDDSIPDLDATPSISVNRREIPDLPEVQDSGASTANFGLLQALLRQYAPGIENWLQKVITIVSPRESPVLYYFLCESLLLIRASGGEPQRRHRAAPPRLASIKEEEEE